MTATRKSTLIISALAVAAIATLLALHLLANDPPYDDTDLMQPRRPINPAQNPLPALKELPLDLGPDDSKSDLDRASQMVTRKIAWDDVFVSDLLSRNAQTLQQVKAALPLSEWQETIEMRMETDISYANEWVAAAKLLQTKAESERRNGDVNAAMEDALDIARFGNRLQSIEGGLVHQLVSMTIAALGHHSITTIIDQEELSPPQLLNLEQELDAISFSPEEFSTCFRFEYQTFRSIINAMLDGKVDLEDLDSSLGGSRLPTTSRLLFKPNKTLQIYGDAMRQHIKESPMIRSQAPRLVSKQLEEKQKNRPKILLSGNAIGEILILVALPVIDKIADRHAMLRTSHEMLKLRIALERYRQKNDRLPRTLTDLVPDFIDTIPIDQFDGSPIRYLPGKKRLYSVGTDLIDDGGQSEGSQLSPRQDDLVLQIDPPPLPELIDSSKPDQRRIVLPAPLRSK
jgi:hypothetical protein